MALVDAVDAHKVAHHKALEVPSEAQNAGEQFLVTGGRYAVDGVVTCHHAACAGVDCRLEGRQYILLKVPPAYVAGAAVVPALRDTVGHKVLEGGYDALSGGAPDHGRCHFRCKVNVLAVGLFNAGPPGLTAKVDDRSVTNSGALSLKFLANHFSNLLDKFSVPRGAKADRSGEHSCADSHVPVRRFLCKYDGNAQPCGVYGIALEFIVSLCGEHRVEAGLKGFLGPRVCPERCPQHAAVLVLDEGAVLIADCYVPVGGSAGRSLVIADSSLVTTDRSLVTTDRSLVITGLIGDLHLFIHGPPQRADQLPQFLFQGHSADKVLSAFLRAIVGVLVYRSFFRACCCHQCSGCNGDKAVKMF